jgi:hypothetical protein
MAPVTVIDELELEWERLSESPSAAAALERWKEEDAGLAQLGRLGDIVADVGENDIDEVLAALTRRAAAEELAARALLQLLLPACRRLVDSRADAGHAREFSVSVVNAALSEVREWALAEGHVVPSSCPSTPFVFGWAGLMAS